MDFATGGGERVTDGVFCDGFLHPRWEGATGGGAHEDPKKVI